MHRASDETPHRPTKTRATATSPDIKFLVANGAGATVIPSGSWLHEVDGEDFAGNGFQKANGRPHRIAPASRLFFG
jgi:hypothetical protein